MPARHFIGILLIPAIFLLFLQPSFADVSADTQKHKESQKYFKEGMKFHEMGQYEKAVESFKEAIKIQPDNAGAYVGLGYSYEVLGNHEKKAEVFEKAVELFKEALKLKPDDANIYKGLGLAYSGLKQYDKAIESYKEALKLKPDDADIYMGLGLAYSDLKQYDKEIEAFKEAIKLKPDDAMTYQGLGVAYGELKQYDKAIEAFKEAIKIKPDDANLYDFLASDYNKIGQYENAIEALKEAIKLTPDDADTYGSLGLAYSDLNQYENAIEAFKEALKLKPDNADIYLSLGSAYSNLKQYGKAVESFEKAVALFKEAIKLKPNDADIYKGLGLAYIGLEQYDKAIESYKEALKLKPDDADIYKGLGIAYSGLKQYDKAIESYKEAIKLKPDDAGTYRSLGFAYNDLKQYDKAIESFKEALKLKPDDAGTYGILGFVYSDLKQYDKAIEAYKEVVKLKPDDPKAYERLGDAYNVLNQYEKAIEVYKEAVKLKPDYADAYKSLGFNYLMLGNQAEAVNYLKVALGLYKKLSDKENEAEVLAELSLFSLIQGKDINSFHDLETALGIYEDLGSLSPFKVTALINIADAYTIFGENNKALQYYRKALEFYEKLEDDVGIINTSVKIAVTSRNIKEMMKYGKQAIKLIEKHALSDNLNIYLTTYYGYQAIVIAYLHSKDYKNAIEYVRKMIDIAQKMKNKGFMGPFGNVYIAESYVFSGMIFENQENYQKALDYYQNAVNLPHAHDLDMSSFKWRPFWRLGRINDTLGNFTEAKNQYFNAVNNLEKLREGAQSLAFKISLGTPATDVYTDTILFLLKTGENTVAFNYMERARSRVFLDLLGGKLKLGNKEVIEEERRLQFRINYLAEKIREANERPDKKVSPQMVTLLEKQLNDARAEYATLLEKMKKENPEISTLLTVNPLTLKEVQNLLDHDTTLLEYFITPEKTLLWVVDKQNAKVLIIDIKSKELASKVEAYREKISKLQPDYKKDADDLYTLLIKPAKPYIKTKRIGIVPHSVLHYLPFQALLNKDKFLIEEYEMFYTPSASVLKFVYEKRKEIKGKVLAFGNPKLDDEKLNLPYAEDEVKKIKTAYPETSLYLREKATEDKAKKLSRDYNIIHFASHGELNTTNPMSSSIRLAKDKDEDGRLDINEIFNLDLKNTSLVTLSACETGLGKLTEGDELVGLTRGFIYAGTPSIVASLWRVNDQSTSELMNLFYKNLKNHPKSEALRMAQLEMIKGKTGKGIVRGVGGITTSKKSKPKPQESETVDGSHPYFWAPFILLGDWK